MKRETIMKTKLTKLTHNNTWPHVCSYAQELEAPNMKNNTMLLFSGGLSKICCTKLDLLQDIRKFYGELFDMPMLLHSERGSQSIAFNSLATLCLYILKLFFQTHLSTRYYLCRYILICKSGTTAKIPACTTIPLVVKRWNSGLTGSISK